MMTRFSSLVITMARSMIPMIPMILGGCAGKAHAPTTALCVLQGTAGNEQVTGAISFTQGDDYVVIEATVNGLTPGSHGFHVHEFGDVNCSDGKCTGGHFNPGGSPHGGPNAPERHVGDLGNLVAGSDGKAYYRRRDDVLSLDMSSPNCIIGRAIIVHSKADDLVSQPTGDAGARVAAGVIGIGKEN